MQTEIEAKWLNIDLDIMRERLTAASAVCIVPERLMKRCVFDYPDNRLQDTGGWVRVRDEGNKITLSYKQINGRSVMDTKEVTVTVDNFDSTCELLRSIGLVQKSYQETKRESWTIDDAEIELDTWPWVPSLIEIEAGGETILQNTAKKLKLDYEKALFGTNDIAYVCVYDVTEDEVNFWPEIRFIPVPQWLEEKRRS